MSPALIETLYLAFVLIGLFVGVFVLGMGYGKHWVKRGKSVED